MALQLILGKFRAVRPKIRRFCTQVWLMAFARMVTAFLLILTLDGEVCADIVGREYRHGNVQDGCHNVAHCVVVFHGAGATKEKKHPGGHQDSHEHRLG